jgi:hypothetical protein
MVSVLLKMLPFALGTITPTMIGLIVLFLTGTRGLIKSFSFILGKYIIYVLLGLLFLSVTEIISSIDSVGTQAIVEIFFLIFGLLLLILAGASIIADASLPPSENFVSILVLALLMVWVMFIPIIVFLAMGKRRTIALKSMRDFLVSNQHKINAGVMLFFGILMIFLGLSRFY